MVDHWLGSGVLLANPDTKCIASASLSSCRRALQVSFLTNRSNGSFTDEFPFVNERLSEHKECIWGGIVTYNPDICRLCENVKSIIPQVQKLLIFDNGSDNVEEIRRAVPDAILIKGKENFGMAKALNRLARAALSGGATYILFLDQDSIAADNLVEEERRYCSERVGLICPLVVDRAHNESIEDESLVTSVKRPITSGSMVNLAAWQAIKGYDERLFVDWVDNEYCDNLRLHNYCIIKTCRTHILHEMGRQEYAWKAPGRDDAGQGHATKSYYRQHYPTWRWYDRARSQAITIRKYGWTKIGVEERYYFLKSTLGRILLLEKNKCATLRAVIKGFREGMSS